LPQVAPHERRRHPVGHQREHAARRLVAQTEVYLGLAVLLLAQPPPPALVEPLDAGPGEVSRRIPLDDLDEAADVRRADLHPHLEPRAEAVTPAVLALPAGESCDQPFVLVEALDDSPDIGRGSVDEG